MIQGREVDKRSRTDNVQVAEKNGEVETLLRFTGTTYLFKWSPHLSPRILGREGVGGENMDPF